MFKNLKNFLMIKFDLWFKKMYLIFKRKISKLFGRFKYSLNIFSGKIK